MFQLGSRGEVSGNRITAAISEKIIKELKYSFLPLLELKIDERVNYRIRNRKVTEG